MGITLVWVPELSAAQLLSLGFSVFFRPIFVLLLVPPFLVTGTGMYLIKDSQGVEESNRIEKSRIAQLLRKLDPENQKTGFFHYLSN